MPFAVDDLDSGMARTWVEMRLSVGEYTRTTIGYNCDLLSLLPSVEILKTIIENLFL